MRIVQCPSDGHDFVNYSGGNLFKQEITRFFFHLTSTINVGVFYLYHAFFQRC